MTASPDRLVVLDFEATCDDVNPPSPQEIIELPSVLVDLRRGEVVDDFVTFVRPHHHPRITPFCHDLTSIRQDEVDRAPPFREAFAAHQHWLGGHGLPLTADAPGPAWAFVTCGDWDLGTMLPAQLKAAAPPMALLPWPYRRWINLKVPFSTWAGHKARGMVSMLDDLGLPLKGRHHRGIDDCHNIARIALALHGRGVGLTLTSRVPRSRFPPITVHLERDGTACEVLLQKRTLGSLLGLASTAFRARVAHATLPDGRVLTDDEDLDDLIDGDQIAVS